MQAISASHLNRPRVGDQRHFVERPQTIEQAKADHVVVKFVPVFADVFSYVLFFHDNGVKANVRVRSAHREG